ncbi:MAG: hypothetical protein Q4C34_06425 [Bacteroidales bacterium]|nr:hypothetical protein [Bacteroidales bacterium]
MLVIRNRLLPIGRRYGAINICGVLFAKRDMQLTHEVINHERIHTRQMIELLIVPFYIIYIIEWLVRVCINRGDTYRSYLQTSFEREAYRHGDDLDYLKHRRLYAQWR